MDRETSYRHKAHELRRLAQTEADATTRLDLELLALKFDRLADQASRNAKNNVVYEYDPQSNVERRQPERQRAQQQQQQQQQQPQPPKRDQ